MMRGERLVASFTVWQDVAEAAVWYFNRHRFHVGFCTGTIVANVITIIFQLYLHRVI